MCLPEKSRDSTAFDAEHSVLCSPVRLGISRNTGIVRTFRREASGSCLQFRLRGGEGGIRTLGTGVSPYNGLANRRIRPLCHLSRYAEPQFITSDGQPYSRTSHRRELSVCPNFASGNLNNGYNDEFLCGLMVEISDSFTGTYMLDPSGNGRVDSSITFDSNGPGPELIFYLTGNGNPPLMLDADSNLGSVGVGLATPQGVPPFSFNGKYGLFFTQGSSGVENDATGQSSVNGTANTLSGIADSCP